MAQLRQRSSVTTAPTTHQNSTTTTNYNSTENGLEQTVENTIRKIKLSFYHELDEWQKDNHFIKSGYVKETNSFKHSFGSLLYIHNETGNIYSHLLPSVFVLGSILYYINEILSDVAGWAQLNFLQFGLACTFCLLMSSIFHSVKSHSHKVSKFGNQLDYFGIIILITCSLNSIILFAYYDEPNIKYTFLITFVVLGSICTFFTLDPKFSSAKYRPIRSTIFILFGLSGTLPVSTSIYKFGLETTMERANVKWLILEGGFYILGAVLYAARVPERFTHSEDPKPGAFDIWGHSHQIFHVFVVIAAYCHWKALVGCYLYMVENLL